MRASHLMLTVILVLLLAGARAADTSPVFDIPRLAGITIDGAADDWGDGGFRVDQFMSVSATNTPGILAAAANHAARLRLGWDDAGLLLLTEIADDRWVEDAQNDRLYAGDAFTVYLAPARGSTDTCQWVIAPGLAPGYDALRTRFFNYRHTEALKALPAALEAARTAIPGGVRIEARLPWSALDIRPSVGREAAFECWSNDVDDPNAATGHRLSWYPLLGAFSDSTRMYRLRLAEQPGPPVTARAFGTLYPDQPPRVMVVGPAALTGTVVQVLSGKSVVTQGTLAGGDLGLATVNLALTRARSGAPDGAYTVLLGDSVLDTVIFPKPDRTDALTRLRARAAFLRAHFNLDQPWDAMADAPALIRRHRGIVALALQWLDARPWTVDDEERQDAVAALAAMIDAVDRGRDALTEQRGTFFAAYYSAVDGSGQPFVVMLPDDFDPNATYPLIVKLHGLGSRPVPEGVLQGHYILVRPWGRGDNFFQALGEDDVLQVIATMRDWYHIDPDRIYLSGGSMGGTGTWNVAYRYPDRFAAIAAYCGTTIGPFLENLRNVPALNQHGGKDTTVPIDMSRYGITRLRQLGYDITAHEFFDEPHDLQGLPSAPWLLNYRRATSPYAVTLTFDEVAAGRAYWLRARAVEDPHRRTTLQASISLAPAQILALAAPNAAVLELEVARMPVDRTQPLAIQCDATALDVPAPLPATVFLVRRDGAWTLSEHWSLPADAQRPYAPGGAAELFSGEPLLIVYGTGGSAVREALWRAAAEKLATFAGVHAMAVGRLPVKTDTAVTPADLTHYNVILLGGPGENAVTARMQPRLPVTLGPDGLRAGDRPPVSVQQAGWGLAYFNPLAPARRIYLLACDASDRELEAWLRSPADLLRGARGLDRVAQPDLYVQDVRGPLRRLMQFTTGWRWRAVTGDDRRLPERAATDYGAELSRLRALRAATGTDAALGEGTTLLHSYDAAWITAADLATLTAPEPTLTGRMTGRELLDLQRNLVPVGALTLLVEGITLQPDRTYRVVMTPNLSKLLAQKRKASLTALDAGPAVPAATVWAEMMK